MAYEVCIPRLGWSMEEGTFIGWLKNDGDTVNAGDPLFELEGEKGVQEIESNDSGVLRIPPNGAQSGSTVAVGALLGYLVATNERAPWETNASPLIDEHANGAVEAASTVGFEDHRAIPEINTSPATAGNDPSRPRASPRARKTANQLGIDLARLTGTGATGRIREADVRRASASATSVNGDGPANASTKGKIVPHSPRRRTIAQRMLASQKRTAPVTLTTRVEVTKLIETRNLFKEVGGPVPTYADIAAKLAAIVLQRHPEMAARWCEDHLQLPADDGFDIGIAVDVEGGLVVPVLRDVARRQLSDIAHDSQRLIALARSGRLAVADMEGGVFTITNLGTYGVDAFTPIIYTPQTAILGLGAIRREPVVLAGDEIAIRDLQTLSLTFDHQAIDGAPAARFLQSLSNAFANPTVWLLGLK